MDPTVLARFGLFVAEDVVDSETCDLLRKEVGTGRAEAATVMDEPGDFFGTATAAASSSSTGSSTASPAWEFPWTRGRAWSIAFPSGTPHGVTEVTHGERYTVVTWFA